MLYEELLDLTGGAATYEQYQEIDAAYMNRESMTKTQAARLWQRRFNKKHTLRRQELRWIKDAIKVFRAARLESEEYGEDTMIHIIYADGSECIATGLEISSGDITPKLQRIVYAHLQDECVEYDTFQGELTYDLSDDLQYEAYEEYLNSIQHLFGTGWSKMVLSKMQ